MSARRFTAVLGGATGERPAVEIPFDVKAEYGSARAKVVATVNGVRLRTTVAVYGGKSYVGFREEIRKAAKIDIGDRITVRLEPDVEPRTVEAPVDLTAALRTDGKAKAAFDALAYSHQREYVRWIDDSKKPETRARRIEQTLARLKTPTPSR
jgi:hypothetical protein